MRMELKVTLEVTEPVLLEDEVDQFVDEVQASILLAPGVTRVEAEVEALQWT